MKAGVEELKKKLKKVTCSFGVEGRKRPMCFRVALPKAPRSPPSHHSTRLDFERDGVLAAPYALLSCFSLTSHFCLLDGDSCLAVGGKVDGGCSA